VLSCDSGGDNDEIFLLGENFTYPTSLGTFWTYQSTEIIEDSNGEILWAFESTLERSIVSEFVNPPESFSDEGCNIKIEDEVEVNLAISQGLEIDFLDEWNQENYIVDWGSGVYYTSLLNDEQEFDTCQSYHLEDSSENEDNSGGENNVPDVVAKIGNLPSINYNLNFLQLEYPLYIGKTWTDGIFSYEIASKENIILDIDGTSTLFESYKIIVNTTSDIGDFEKVYYLSNIGIVKASYESDMMDITIPDDDPEGTGEQGRLYYQMNLINYSISE